MVDEKENNWLLLKYRKCVNCIILLWFAILRDRLIRALLLIHIIWQGTKCSFSQKAMAKKELGGKCFDVKNVWEKNVLGESLGNHENIYLSIVTS